VVPDQEPESLPHVAWQFREYRIGEDERHWAKHGFAVLDLEPDHILVHHVDDGGHCYCEERIPEDA
jgi:hypothetical protein